VKYNPGRQKETDFFARPVDKRGYNFFFSSEKLGLSSRSSEGSEQERELRPNFSLKKKL
jgi:hypothetical protein